MKYDLQKEARSLARVLGKPESLKLIEAELKMAFMSGEISVIKSRLDELSAVTGDKK